MRLELCRLVVSGSHFSGLLWFPARIGVCGRRIGIPVQKSFGIPGIARTAAIKPSRVQNVAL
jgi:hypothetical protein